MSKETSEPVATIAGRILSKGNPLDDQEIATTIENSMADNGVEAAAAARIMETITEALAPRFEDMLTLAGSALSQAEDREDGTGMQINLVDVFSAWGEREARDTALLMDMCLAAAIEQLVPFTVVANLWPAEVEIAIERLEALFDQGRIVRLAASPNVWRLRLAPPTEGAPPNELFGKLGTIRRYITAFEEHHSYYETMADAVGEAGSTAYHEERRKLGQALLAVLDGHTGKQDDPRRMLPGEDVVQDVIAEGRRTSQSGLNENDTAAGKGQIMPGEDGA